MTKKELISLIESMGFVVSDDVESDDCYDCWTFPEQKDDYFIDIDDDKLKIYSNNMEVYFEDNDFYYCCDTNYNTFQYKDKNPFTKELIKMGLKILIENYKAAKKKLRLDKINEL